jgi:hypothetical protein
MTEFAPLILRLVTVIVLVVGAAHAAERAGPLWGSIIATLPVAVGPAYVMLALDHNAGFIAESALASLASHMGLAAFLLVYVKLAPRFPSLPSLAGALLAWIAAALLPRIRPGTLPTAIVANMAAFGLAIYATRDAMAYKPPRAGAPRAYELPLRALLVGALVIGVVAFSNALGPAFTGIVATAPVVLTSLALILHPRLGGKGVAAVMAGSVRALPGLGFGYAVLCLAAERMHIGLALTLALLVTLCWPVGLVLRQRALRQRALRPA